MTWTRPVPVIGDPSSALDRRTDPRGWGFNAADRDALYRVIAARRDIRRFRPDPVPGHILERVISAAHCAPSVGHSQPWRFIIVRDSATRERAALLADRERHAQAAQMNPESARRLLDLQLDGLRDAPIGVVVCCDRRAPAAGVLGRATFADADMWSCACAIENLWLAARADGLGVGWVTLFKPQELAELLGLSDGVETLGWLCLGWPDERPPTPGLERAAWSRKTPLSEVILHERWPSDTEAPPGPTSHLRAPDQPSVVAVRDDADRLLTPPGSLGALDRAVDRLLALGHPSPETGTLVLVGADHQVATHRVSAYPQSVTAEVLRAAVAGRALGVVTATTAGLGNLVVDAGCEIAVDGALPARPCDPRGDLVNGPALTPNDVDFLIERGRVLGRSVSTGVVALGEVGVGNTTVAAALTAALLDLPADRVVGLGAGADTAMLERKAEVIVAAVNRARGHRADLHDPPVALSELGGPEFAVLTGVVLGAAEGGSAVVLDGLATTVAAALAVNLEPAAAAHLIAGQRSREAAHGALLGYLGLEALLDLRIRAGEGVGACLSARLIHDTLRIRALTARTAR